MNSSRVFHWTLCISLALHIGLLIYIPGFKTGESTVAAPVISFVRIPLAEKAEMIRSFVPVSVEKERPRAVPGTDPLAQDDPPLARPVPRVAKEQPAPAEPVRKQAREQPLPFEAKQLAALPLPLAVPRETPEMEGMYTNYYKIINDRLQRAAVSPDDFTAGDIMVSFVLLSDGSLASVTVLPDSSTANNSLQQTALQIVRNASPFPPFPRDMRRVDLTFNVVICFREQS